MAVVSAQPASTPGPQEPQAAKGNVAELFAAVASGSIDAVRQAQAAGTPLDVADEGGRTAVMVAAETGDVAMIEMLLAEGCTLGSTSAQGWTPLAYAAFAGKVDVIRLLVARGMTVDEPDVSGATPLSWAAAKGHAAAVRALLELGADAGACDVHGRTALAHAAGGMGDVPTIEALVAAETCNVNATDLFGRTPLISAVLANKPHAVDALAKAGADVHIADRYVPTIVGPPTCPSQASVTGVESTAAEQAVSDASAAPGKTALDHARERKFKHIESYLLALIKAAASGGPIREFPPVIDQVLIRERMRAKIAREAEGGVKASSGGGGGASEGEKGARVDADENIFTELDDADETDGKLDESAAVGEQVAQKPEADAEDLGGSLEDLD